MQTFMSFKDYLDSELKNKFEEIELERVQNREKASKFYLLLVVTILSAAVISIFITFSFLQKSNESFQYKVLTGSLFCILLASVITLVIMVIYSYTIGANYAYFREKIYATKYKQSIIPSMINFFDKNLTYCNEGLIEKDFFVESKLFSKVPDEYYGEDLITGCIGATDVKLSFVSAYENTDKGSNQFFSGMLYIADFCKNFSGTAFVLPDKTEKHLGHISQLIQGNNSNYGELVKLENLEFEKLFKVYGNNQIEARYILTPSLMERIVDFSKKIGKDFYMSFVNSKVFVLIPYPRNILDPQIDSLPFSSSQLLEYYENIKLFINIVEDLNLNTRIWSK